METLQHLVFTAYLMALAILFVYGANSYVIILARRRHRAPALKRRRELQRLFRRHLRERGWPQVTVQLPVYNERYVVERLIDAVCGLDYPSDRLEIQVLDDSTDDTAALLREKVRRMRSRGVNIRRLHRAHREGFKAGALGAGLACAAGEFIVIFDADFLPAPDFIRRALPYFSDPRIGMLQARWGHLNADYSLLTRAQAIGIDGHFMLEQSSRAWAGWFMNFNGTAGVWRRTAIEEAGGWQGDTLTEDLDLSYRAQLKGWKLMLDPRLVCPGELPVTISAFKAQQRRWAKGSIQTARKTLRAVMASRARWTVKAQAFFHLTHYLVHPLILLVVLMSIPTLYTPIVREHRAGPLLLFGALWLSALGPTAVSVLSQRLLYPDWRRRLACLPVLMCLGVGISVGNSLAVLEALFNVATPFVRTPKYGICGRAGGWRGKGYNLPNPAMAFGELALGLYALSGFTLFLAGDRILPSPFLLMYAAGFFYVFALSWRQSRPPRTPRR
jgi:cellulose synthase/poly-beta-1,6-N-acetylglucosamine synthase-like glycosyltransferase